MTNTLILSRPVLKKILTLLLLIVNETKSFSLKSSRVCSYAVGKKYDSRTTTTKLFAMVNLDDESLDSDDSPNLTNRRSFARSTLLSTLIATMTTTTTTISFRGSNDIAIAAEVESSGENKLLKKYIDKDYGFEILVPSTWDQTTQSLPDRRRIEFWFDPTTTKENDKTLIFIAYTPIRDDYTSLGSFGSVEEVASQTILPKGSLMGDNNVKSQLLNAESKNNAYFFDYTVQAGSNQPNRHFRTVFFLAPTISGAAGTQLITITAQTSEDKYLDAKKNFDDIINSFSGAGGKPKK